MSPRYMTYTERREITERRQHRIDAFIVGLMFGTGLGLSLLAGLIVGQTYLAG